MEAASRRFRIAATTFHTTSTRPIPRYSPFPFGIRTTTCQMASSASCLSLKSSLTRDTNFYRCVIALVSVSLFSSVFSLLVPLITAIATSDAVAFAATAFSFRASSNHSFRFSVLILEGPLEWWFLSLFIAHYILSSVGTEYSTWNVSTDTGVFYPGGHTWRYMDSVYCAA